MIQKILLVLLLVFAVLQFFQIEKTNIETDPEVDFMNITSPPDEVATILKTACYDCHSEQTKYPWYTYIQPVGWWVADHIDNGRDELNFSEWGTFSYRKADHKLEEAAEYVLSEEMPLPSYTWGHAEARLTDEEREFLAAWFEDQRDILEAEQEVEEELNNELESETEGE